MKHLRDINERLAQLAKSISNECTVLVFKVSYNSIKERNEQSQQYLCIYPFGDIFKVKARRIFLKQTEKF